MNIYAAASCEKPTGSRGRMTADDKRAYWLSKEFLLYRSASRSVSMLDLLPKLMLSNNHLSYRPGASLSLITCVQVYDYEQKTQGQHRFSGESI